MSLALLEMCTYLLLFLYLLIIFLLWFLLPTTMLCFVLFFTDAEFALVSLSPNLVVSKFPKTFFNQVKPSTLKKKQKKKRTFFQDRMRSPMQQNNVTPPQKSLVTQYCDKMLVCIARAEKDVIDRSKFLLRLLII